MSYIRWMKTKYYVILMILTLELRISICIGETAENAFLSCDGHTYTVNSLGQFLPEKIKRNFGSISWHDYLCVTSPFVITPGLGGNETYIMPISESLDRGELEF